jgi:hypothetical protein
VRTAASDSAALGLIGLAALLALVAAYYDRITGITLPGGGGITLSAAQQEAAAKAAGKAVQSSLAAAAPYVQPRQTDVVAFYARSADPTQGLRPGDRDLAAEDLATKSGQATVRMTARAERLMNVANSPARLDSEATLMGIVLSADEVTNLRDKKVPSTLWSKLAETAVAEVKLTAP